jgi:EAL domain-containing protein (putative c-di-GMP-specific phosphodiesterase class I)/FixJ family two-component response regulator
MSVPSENREAVAPALAAVNIGEIRFLVVEDHGFQRWVIGNLLATLGAKHVYSAPDGIAALELYKTLEPPVDIIVSDLDMPGMDGLEFIRHVGEVGRPVSLILVSGLERSLIASVESMARAYGVHLLGAIEKPATAKKLTAAIAAYGAGLHGVERAKPAPILPLEEILQGLARDEFTPYFQAKMDLETGEVRGAEAVARWLHPEHGIVTPQGFVKALEECGRIAQLTDLMLRQGAKCCARWMAAGSQATLAVNLSLVSLSDMSIAERFTEIATAEGIKPRNIVLEITESAAATHLGKVLENLSRLRMKGFGLSIDDYGTGYSSMQQLTRIAFTELKIDQSFVRNSAQPSSRAMIESSLEMAEKLDIVAVAEGIETRAEWDLLRELGCPMGQGYFIARPMDATEFLRYLRDAG